MWDDLVRRWRVEAALWVCYWHALDRDDRPSIRYCADHSLLLSAFWLVVLIGGLMAFGMFVQFLQEAAGDAGSFFLRDISYNNSNLFIIAVSLLVLDRI